MVWLVAVGALVVEIIVVVVSVTSPNGSREDNFSESGCSDDNKIAVSVTGGCTVVITGVELFRSIQAIKTSMSCKKKYVLICILFEKMQYTHHMKNAMMSTL